MNTKKELKEAFDVNQVMNNLLNEVAEAASTRNSSTLNHLINIRDLLNTLKTIDKTSEFVLQRETLDNIRKALSGINLPSGKNLKELGVEISTPDKTLKQIDEAPKTGQEARSKLNKVFTDQLGQTIQVLNDIIEVGIAGEKNAQAIPSTDRIDKILLEIVTTLFGTGLKQFVEVNLPDDASSKNVEEITLSKNRSAKLENPTTEASEPSEKIIRDVGRTNLINKQVFGIGNIPDFTAKNAAPINAELDITTKAQNELSSAAGKSQKIEDAVSQASIGNKTELDLIETDLLTDGGKISLDAGAAIKGDNKTINEAEVPGLINKSTNDIDTDTTPDGVKPTSPDEWYRNWGFPSGNNNLNNQALSLFGGRVDLAAVFKGAIGQALGFFGVTSADVVRMANKAARDFNSEVNAFTLFTGIQNAFVSRSVKQTLTEADLQNFDQRTFAGTAGSGELDTVARKGLVAPDGSKGNVVTETNLPPAQQQMLRQIIGDRGKTIADEGSRGGDYPVDDLTLTLPEKQLEGFQQRTFDIVGGKKGTGFLKIYLRRGPKFSDSLSDTQVIPFQFEPIVSGDAKAAEYSQISTLARSQSAQVYRKSTERTISLELNYLVVQKPSDLDQTNLAVSESVKDMQFWTEDYIYDYIVRNLRNLVLPNLTSPQYKLAPPIVQVWYGGIDSQSASSTGEGVTDTQNNQLNDVFPTFRTNWYSYGNNGFEQRSYRSLWICSNVGFDYKGGIVNRSSRRYSWVTATLSLTEIAPSVTDNEILIWSPSPPNQPIG